MTLARTDFASAYTVEAGTDVVQRDWEVVSPAGQWPTVATSCPACLMHIRMTLRRRGLDRRVTHLANVIV